MATCSPRATSRGVGARRLDLDGAALRQLAGQWLGALLELAGHEQAAVGDAGAGVGQVDEAAHLGLEVVADVVEQRGQRAVAGGLGHGAARGADVAQLGEVGFEGVHGSLF